MIASGKSPEGAEKPLGALDVGIQRVERRGEGGLRIALSGQVKHIIGSAGLDAILDRHRIPQIGIMKLDPAAGVNVIKMTGDVIQRTPPAKHAVDFPICMPEKVIQEM